MAGPLAVQVRCCGDMIVVLYRLVPTHVLRVILEVFVVLVAIHATCSPSVSHWHHVTVVVP